MSRSDNMVAEYVNDCLGPSGGLLRHIIARWRRSDGTDRSGGGAHGGLR